ncbi:MAG TPA: RnfABCDGE type electron transport complex subunit D [Clostridiales bacterium]|jgi:electron transport complex protein RnfD|nr:RnfABCDGE type electron transport complex subunit D [Clostridiales bacterium]
MSKELSFAVSSSPHIRSDEDTRSIMLDVIISLIPALAVAIYIFGLRSLTLTLVCVAACVFFEWGYRKLLKKPSSVGDLSAVVTGMLLTFCLPVTVPYWIPVIGAFFAIVIVKQLYGGIGKNFLNPALAARAFLFSWPVIMTTWAAPLSYSRFANIFSVADAITSATPMEALHAGRLPDATLWQAFIGEIGGSLGEISSLVLLLGGIYLVIRKVINPRIPLTYILTVAVVTFIFPKGGADSLTWMLYNLFCGGLMLGAIFMATDYATSPVTKKGQIIYGIGCGLLTVFIRYFGSYVEGVSYAILIMNVTVWLIDKSTLPRRFGIKKAAKEGAKK